jgi:hypothetical protein
MKLTDFDLETAFQTALAQFDDRPEVKRALSGFYRGAIKLLAALIRADARAKRGEKLT